MWTVVTLTAQAVTIVLLVMTYRARKRADKAQARNNKAIGETIVRQTEMIVDQERKIAALRLQVSGVIQLFIDLKRQNGLPQAELSQVDKPQN